MAPESTRPEILLERRGAAGIVILNRPQALNAVTIGMVDALARQLAEWDGDPAVSRVILTAAGERAFSAGGDLRALFDLGRSGHHEAARGYWRAGHAPHPAIKHHPQPHASRLRGNGLCARAGRPTPGLHPWERGGS